MTLNELIEKLEDIRETLFDGVDVIIKMNTDSGQQVKDVFGEYRIAELEYYAGNIILYAE